jgi:hypothetical protein
MSPAISIRDIDRGIVFLMAEWSGPAQVAWRQLCEFADGYRGAKPRIIKMELQEGAPVYDVPELSGKIHGWGEAMVVRGGQIVYFTVLGKEQVDVQGRCQELVRAYEG